MKKVQIGTIVGLGIFLVLVGLILIKTLKVFSIISILIGAFAVFKGIMIYKYYDSKENIKSISKSEQKIDVVTEKKPSGEEEIHILGIKVRPGAHTKIIKKVEPSVENLKTMVFWPFVPKKEAIEEETTKPKDFKFCKVCGTKMQRISRFCNECGKQQ